MRVFNSKPVFHLRDGMCSYFYRPLTYKGNASFTLALELEAYKQAEDIHLKLMTDHISEVSQWIVGIKKLIQSAIGTK